MDTKQMEYILKIAEENNITHAAEKLFITQSALNQQLLRLEKELGTPLFHRSRSNWHLTEAGKIYVENAKKIVGIKKQTYEKIACLSSGKSGILSVGFTPGRGTSLFTSAYKTFHEKYPDFVIQPYETSVHELQRKIQDEELDFAFVTLQAKEQTDDVYNILYEEEIQLVLPSSLDAAKKALKAGRTTLPLTAVASEPFVLMSAESTMYSIVDDLFTQAKITPNVLFHTRNNYTILSMIQANLCCGLLPAYYTHNLPKEAACFSLPSKPVWQFAVTYKKGTKLSSPAQYFINIINSLSHG